MAQTGLSLSLLGLQSVSPTHNSMSCRLCGSRSSLPAVGTSEDALPGPMTSPSTGRPQPGGAGRVARGGGGRSTLGCPTPYPFPSRQVRERRRGGSRDPNFPQGGVLQEAQGCSSGSGPAGLIAHTIAACTGASFIIGKHFLGSVHKPPGKAATKNQSPTIFRMAF